MAMDLVRSTFWRAQGVPVDHAQKSFLWRGDRYIGLKICHWRHHWQFCVDVAAHCCCVLYSSNSISDDWLMQNSMGMLICSQFVNAK